LPFAANGACFALGALLVTRVATDVIDVATDRVGQVRNLRAEIVWGTTSTVVRQRAVPDELLGRVTGVYQVGLIGGIVVGTPIGGLLARTFGITAPFWFGFIGSALLVAVLWRQFEHIVHASES
jgi:predicted MFS family arabinose efflux permease